MTRLVDISLEDYRIPLDYLDRVLSPALIVFVDKVRQNLQTMLGHLGGDPNRWRPHLKTTKIPEIYAEILDSGVRHFKCATAREAAVLCQTPLRRTLGARHRSSGTTVSDTACTACIDVLLAYPITSPALERVACLAREHPEAKLSVLCEDPDAVGEIPGELGIFVDINPGMNRTGIPLTETDKILQVAQRAAERFCGLHYYDGHIRDPQRETRRERSHILYDRLLEIHSALRQEGIPVPELITSGTPSFLYALSYVPFMDLEGTQHRVSPGTVVFHDAFSDEIMDDLDLVPAAVVLSRVVSHPTDGIVTCDAGSKSVAAEAGDPVAFVLGHSELVAQKPSEEHLPLKVAAGSRLPTRGEVLLLVPRHVCPTVNLAEQALLMEHAKEPRVVSVAARAHELLWQTP